MKVSIGLFVAFGVFALILSGGIASKCEQDSKRTAEREAFCTRLCEIKQDSFHAVKRQQIGFGSIEHRCFCESGHWQVIP